MDHLISIICYTDWTDLQKNGPQTKFTGELLSSIKQRHKSFYFLSKSLMEAVQYFGNQCISYNWSGDTGYTVTYIEERGPFFCGMSCIMPLPCVNINFHSPLSTSVHQEVASKFAGDDGILIRLNNNGVNINERTGFFNASWISTYPEEAERYNS